MHLLRSWVCTKLPGAVLTRYSCSRLRFTSAMLFQRTEASIQFLIPWVSHISPLMKKKADLGLAFLSSMSFLLSVGTWLARCSIFSLSDGTPPSDSSHQAPHCTILLHVDLHMLPSAVPYLPTHCCLAILARVLRSRCRKYKAVILPSSPDDSCASPLPSCLPLVDFLAQAYLSVCSLIHFFTSRPQS